MGALHLGRRQVCWHAGPVVAPLVACTWHQLGDRKTPGGAPSLQSSATTLGRGTYLCLARALSTAQQRLRAYGLFVRIVFLYCDDPSHASPTRLLTLFRRPLMYSTVIEMECFHLGSRQAHTAMSYVGGCVQCSSLTHYQKSKPCYWKKTGSSGGWTGRG